MSDREKGRVNLRAIIDYFKANPDYSSTKTLARATGQHRNSVQTHCRNLIRLGYLEENVFWVDYPHALNGRHVIHYRRRLFCESILTKNAPSA